MVFVAVGQNRVVDEETGMELRLRGRNEDAQVPLAFKDPLSDVKPLARDGYYYFGGSYIYPEGASPQDRHLSPIGIRFPAHQLRYTFRRYAHNRRDEMQRVFEILEEAVKVYLKSYEGVVGTPIVRFFEEREWSR